MTLTQLNISGRVDFITHINITYKLLLNECLLSSDTAFENIVIWREKNAYRQTVCHHYLILFTIIENLNKSFEFFTLSSLAGEKSIFSLTELSIDCLIDFLCPDLNQYIPGGVLDPMQLSHELEAPEGKFKLARAILQEIPRQVCA